MGCQQGGGDCWPRRQHCWFASTGPNNTRTDTCNRRTNCISKGTRGRGVWGCEWSNSIIEHWSGSHQHNCSKSTHNTNSSASSTAHRWWCSKWRPEHCKPEHCKQQQQQCHQQWWQQQQQQHHQQQQQQHHQQQQQQWQQCPPIKQQPKVLEQCIKWWNRWSKWSCSSDSSSRGKFPWRCTPTGWWSPTVLLSPTVAVFSSGVPATWWWQLPSRVISTVWSRSQPQAADRGQLDTGWRAGGCTTTAATTSSTAAAG